MSASLLVSIAVSISDTFIYLSQPAVSDFTVCVINHLNMPAKAGLSFQAYSAMLNSATQ